jgi:hypothetical protein
MGVLTRMVLGAAGWLVLVSASGAVFSAAGWWSPWLAWPVALALAFGSWWAVRPLARGRSGGATGPGPRAAIVALVAVCAGLSGWAAATRSEQVIIHRDAASNIQAAISVATTGQRVVPVDVAALGGPEVLRIPGVTLGSPAFYQVGSGEEPAIQPQFVIGPAIGYGFGWWAGGAGVALVLPALATGLALLALGLLVGRLLGRWWGVVAAALVGVLFPVVHVARATYSEPLALLTLGAGLLALTTVAGSRTEGAAAMRRAGVLAGMLVGGTGLIRVDALRETVLLVPVLCLAVALRERWARPTALGLGVSLAVSAGAAGALSYRYVGDIAASLVPLVLLGALGAGGSIGALVLWRRGVRLPGRIARILPTTAGGLVVLVGGYLASRPFWQVTRQDPNDPGARYVAGMQARSGLAVDGGRTYAEQTLAWLSWYVGPVALVVALVVLAALVRRAVHSVLDGRLEPWLPALVVATTSTLLTLLRPGITPDHPWADRRLLIALPLVVVLVVVAAAWCRRRGAASGRPVLAVLGPVGLVLAVAAPAVVATWPHRAGGIERGSLDAVARVCDRLRPGDVVLAVDSRAAGEWPQVVRGMCGTSTLALTTPVRREPAAVADAVARIATRVAAGDGRLVLFSANSPATDEVPEALRGPGVVAQRVVDVVVREDEHALERRPVRTDPLPVRVWLGFVGGADEPG